MVFLHQVAGESAKLYAAITDGIVNLVDKVGLGLYIWMGGVVFLVKP
jgi:hypothetical protein